jgi:CHAT domain-containing protein
MPAKRVVLGEYFTTEDLTLLFIVRADFDEPKVVEVKTPLNEIRQFVAANFSVAEAGSKVRDLDLDEWQARFGPFVEPILPWAGEGDILWLVPHDMLHYLPLHALKVEGHYLAERNPVCYTPSASVMKYCHAKRKPQHGGGALVLGDSRGDLPFSRIEAQRIAGLLNCHPTLGAAASRQSVTDALAAEGQREALDVLHFACHGTFDPVQALKSGIVLADVNGEGTLTAEEIFGLQMRAELVTLSACESGVNERRPGDELIGLTRALIYAGTPSVLVSLWAVDDLSTGLLMDKFYAGWRDGLGKAEALQAAQGWLRGLSRDEVLAQVVAARDAAKPLAQAGGQEADQARRLWLRLDAGREALLEDYQPSDHPFDQVYHWAPFVLVGDWR